MSTQDKMTRVVLPLLIIAIGIGGAALMIKLKKAPEKAAAENRGSLVQVEPVKSLSHRVEVSATGTVVPQQEISLTAQVSGETVFVSPRLTGGGFFAKGEKLLAIEPADFQLAVEQAKANLAKAELSLATVESRARVAREEWRRLNTETEAEPNPLALYQPQLKEAKANILSAGAALRQAQLNLERTVLRAPFNCRVRSEQVDLGQYLRAGSSIAVLAGTDAAEIVVPLPLHELGWIDIPRQGSDRPGSRATVQLSSDGRRFSWEGAIDRSLGEMDSRGRMARVIVRVDDPYRLRAGSDGVHPDLAVGMFVDVVLHGHDLERVIAIPRSALRENDTVWTVDDGERLRIRPVHVRRRERETLYLDRGLSEGERIVLTTLSAAAEGMKLRPQVKGATR